MRRNDFPYVPELARLCDSERYLCCRTQFVDDVRANGLIA
jgi:hypothetical protein